MVTESGRRGKERDIGVVLFIIMGDRETKLGEVERRTQIIIIE